VTASPRSALERTRYLVVSGWNILFGYGLFAAAVLLFGHSLSALEASNVPVLSLLGRGYYLLVSWIGWAIAVPQAALATRRVAYRDETLPSPPISRVYELYLPAQVVGSVLLWAAVGLLGFPPVAGGFAAIIIAVVLSYIAQTYVGFRVPLVVGEVRPAAYASDYNVVGSLRALRKAFGAVLHDVFFLPSALALARRRGTVPYVFSGASYHHASAGVRAWHRIIHEMNERGMVAFSLDDVNPDWNERRITRIGYRVMRALGDPIVVYPEVVTGNPLGSKRVVRFVANTPGYLGGDTEYPDTELVFAWMRRYYDTDRILRVDTIERDLFNSRALPEKDVDCAYLGKAEFRGVEESPQTFGMTHITRFPHWPPTRKQLAELLRRTRVLYTYDDCTMLLDEALLCGCDVILLPEGRRLTEADTAGHLTQEEYDAQLARFIDETQHHRPE